MAPTKSVVEGFGEITVDNRHIITMKWVVEGVALILIGTLVAAVTLLDSTGVVSKAVYLICASGFLVLAMVSLVTGFKIRFLPFRLCRLVLSVSAFLILVGGLI